MGSSRMSPSVPTAVTFAAILAFGAAIYNAIIGVWLLIIAARPGTVTGWYWEVSDWYWVISGLLDLFLAVAFVWLGRRLLTGDSGAWWFGVIFAGFNVIFGLFNLPYGLIALTLSAIALACLFARSSRDYFGT